MRRRHTWLLLGAIFSSGLGLAACGQKGPLVLPNEQFQEEGDAPAPRTSGTQAPSAQLQVDQIQTETE